MGTMSLRDTWSARHPDLALSDGVKKRRNPFWSTPGVRCPFDSLRTMMDSFTWAPSSAYRYTDENYDYPDEQDKDWQYNLQGVSHDDSHWFFAETTRIWRLPLSYDLESDEDSPPFPNVGIPDGLEDSGYNHIGDIDHHDGLLYAPLEHKDKERPSILLVFDADLRFVGRTTFSAQATEGPWCAVGKLDGYLYSSAFDSGIDGLYVYDRLFAKADDRVVGVNLEPLGRFPLFDEAGAPLAVPSVQGASFTPPRTSAPSRGHFYLVSDNADTSAGGVMGFEMYTGRRAIHFPVDYEPSSRQELEGMTVWDIDGLGAPSIGGQVHLIMMERDSLASHNDDLYFKHYRIAGYTGDDV